VLTSRYCRTRETARLAFGDAEDFAALDPPSADEAERKAQLDEIVAAVANYSGSGNLVLVTHLETIQALTEQTAREAEAVIVRSADGQRLQVLARIIFN
jgi:phosphohistidine phosphatase SixA